MPSSSIAPLSRVKRMPSRSTAAVSSGSPTYPLISVFPRQATVPSSVMNISECFIGFPRHPATHFFPLKSWVQMMPVSVEAYVLYRRVLGSRRQCLWIY